MSVIDTLRAKESAFKEQNTDMPFSKRKKAALLTTVMNTQRKSTENYAAALELRATALTLLAPNWGNSRKGIFWVGMKSRRKFSKKFRISKSGHSNVKEAKDKKNTIVLAGKTARGSCRLSSHLI